MSNLLLEDDIINFAFELTFYALNLVKFSLFSLSILANGKLRLAL